LTEMRQMKTEWISVDTNQKNTKRNGCCRQENQPDPSLINFIFANPVWKREETLPLTRILKIQSMFMIFNTKDTKHFTKDGDTE
jgi:hypothetical protein